MPRPSPLWLVVFVACTAGPVDNVVCQPALAPSIVVLLTDGATGHRGVPGFVDVPNFDDLHFGTIRDGDFLDSLRAMERKADTLFSLQAAHERPGLYEVLVQIDGFDNWTASRVEVTQGVCHVNMGALEAVLTRRAP